MINKLPRWVWIGGSILAFIAGMINAVGFMGFRHQSVTHLTGTTTLLGIAVASGDGMTAMGLFAVAASFLAGSIFSGILIQQSTLKLGGRYGIALLIESILLFGAIPLLNRLNPIGDYLACAACGLQNGMASTYSGAVLRTTHVSGIFTDLGIFIGHYIRRLPVDRKRMQLYLILLCSFFCGGGAGASAFKYFSYNTLLFPATLTGFTGFAYAIYRRYMRASVDAPHQSDVRGS
jgi:uncharacterized membrane protein YoaK (UPF0700 family)